MPFAAAVACALSFWVQATPGQPGQGEEREESGAPAAVEESVGPSMADRLRDNRTTYKVGVAAELRSGHQTSPGPATTDIEVNPLAAVRVPIGLGGLTLAYDPRLFIIGSSAPQKTSYLHRMRIQLDADTRRLRYYLGVRAAYGDADFSPLSTVVSANTNSSLPTNPQAPPGNGAGTPQTPVPTPSTGTLPSERFLHVLSVEGSGGLVFSISARTGWLASLGYTWGGGADTAARASLPIHKGFFGSTGPITEITREDTLAVQLVASDMRYSNITYGEGPHATLASLESTWTHSWSATWQSDLVGGVAGFHNVVPCTQVVPPTCPAASTGVQVRNGAEPVAGFAIRQLWPGPAGGVRNTLQFRLAPFPDQLSGIVYERVDGVLSSTLQVTDRLSIGVVGSMAAALAGTQRDYRVEGRISYTFGPWLTVSLGGRAAWYRGLLGTTGTPTGGDTTAPTEPPTTFGWVGLVSVATYLGNLL